MCFWLFQCAETKQGKARPLVWILRISLLLSLSHSLSLSLLGSPFVLFCLLILWAPVGNCFFRLRNKTSRTSFSPSSAECQRNKGQFVSVGVLFSNQQEQNFLLFPIWFFVTLISFHRCPFCIFLVVWCSACKRSKSRVQCPHEVYRNSEQPWGSHRAAIFHQDPQNVSRLAWCYVRLRWRMERVEKRDVCCVSVHVAGGKKLFLRSFGLCFAVQPLSAPSLSSLGPVCMALLVRWQLKQKHFLIRCTF